MTAPDDERERSPLPGGARPAGAGVEARGPAPPAGGESQAERAARAVMAAAVRRGAAAHGSLELIKRAAADVVRAVEGSEADVVPAVKGAVTAAIEAAGRGGVDEQAAAEAAAIGALEAAGEVEDPAVVERLKQLLTGEIGGVQPLTEALFSRGRRTP
jgi:hypothetical protein